MENRMHIILISPAKVCGSREDVQSRGHAPPLAEMAGCRCSGVGELLRSL